MTAVLEREKTVSINLFNSREPGLAASSCVSSNTNNWQYSGGMSRGTWVTPGTIYVGGQINTSPPFAPVQRSPFEGLEALGRIKDYTVPTHNYEPHCDILGNPVGCKHCPYANVHKLDPASHPFTIYEEA